MRKKTYYIKQSVVLSLALALLSACGSSGGGSKGADAGPSGESVKVPEQPKEPVELTIYSASADTEEYFNARFGNTLKAKFPNYTIKFIADAAGTLDQKMERLIVAKTPVDIIMGPNGTLEKQLFQFGMAHDMTPLAKKHGVDLGQFNPAFKEVLGTAFGGRIFYFPVQADVPLLYYNKDLFDKFGVEYPKDGMTWDDLYASARRLSRNDGGVKYLGFFPWDVYLFSGNQMVIPYLKPGTTTPTINTDAKWKSFFQTFFVDWGNTADKGAFKNLVFLTEFFQGRSAMTTFLGANMTSSKADLEKMKFDIAAMPVLKESPKIGPAPYSINMAIVSTSKNKDAAMEALKHILSKEAQSGLAKIGIAPVIQNNDAQKLLGTESFFKDKHWSSVFYNQWATTTYYGPMLFELRDIYLKYGKEVLNNGMDVNTALRMAEEDAKKKVEDLKATIVVENVY